MTVRGMTPKLRRCKRLVLAGLRGKRLGDALGISARMANNYIQQLLFMGELIEIKGPKRSTPRVFSDGKPTDNPYKNDIEMCQTVDNDGNATIVKRVVPTSNASEINARPLKTVRFHCTGCYDVPVMILGDHGGVIRDSDGYTVGEWSDIKDVNGSKRQYGKARLYPGEDLPFTLYLARAGPKLTVTPCPRQVYYKTADIEGPRALTEQVLRLINLLTDVHGWQLGAPVYKGVDHYALDSPDLSPLLKYADRQTDPDNARVHVDTSEGAPEIEVYNDHPGAVNDVITLYELPERIEGITASLTAVHGTLTLLADNVTRLTEITAKLVNNQAQQATILNSQYIPNTNTDNIGYR